MPSAKILQAEMFEHALMPAVRPRHHVEHQIQAGFIALVRMHEPRYPDLRFVFAVPNGEVRPRVQDERGRWYSPGGQRLRDEGMRPGVPDVWFPIPRGDCLGWVCEFKAPKRYPTKDQKRWLVRLGMAGWQCHVHRDPVEAWESLKGFMELPV